MKKFILLLFSIAILSPSLATAQAYHPQWMYKYKGNHINSLVEDSINIWVGTQNGLIRINKTTNNKTFYNCLNSDIPINKVRKLFIDHNQNLWLSDKKDHLAKYDGQNWTFYKVSNNNESWRIEDIKEDANHAIWVSTNQHGIIKFDGQNRTYFQSFEDSGYSYPHFILKYNYALAFDKNNNLIASTFLGIAKYSSAGKWTFRDNIDATHEIPAGDITVMKTDNNGDIWAGSVYYEAIAPDFGGGDVSKHDNTGWHIIHTPHNISHVTDLSFDNNNTVYIATMASGVLKYDGSQLSALTYPNNQSIHTANVSAVLYDHNGNLWIGTANGLYKMTANNLTKIKTTDNDVQANWFISMFQKKDGTYYTQHSYIKKVYFYETFDKLYKITPTDTVGFYHKRFGGVNIKYEDPNGSLWGNTMRSLVKITDTTIQYLYADTNILPRNARIFDISWDNVHNEFWLATQIGLISYKNGQWQFHGGFMGGNKEIYSVFADSTGCVWVGTYYNHGIAKYKNNQWITQNFSWGMYNKPITHIFEDKHHNIWFVDPFNAILGKYKNNIWTIYNQNNSPLSGQLNISGIDCDSNNVYVNLGSKVVAYNGNSWDTLPLINEKLSNNDVNNIFVDNNQNIWFMEYKGGVTIYNPNGIILSTPKPAKLPISKNTFKVYPNPSADNITIISTIKAKQITVSILDIQGKKLIEKTIDNTYHNPVKINTKNLLPGVYIISLETNDNREFEKLIIQ